MKNDSKNQELFNNYSNLDLQKLPDELKKNGYDYKLVMRENEKCIYAQMRGTRIVAYEVFKTKIVAHREAILKFKKHFGLDEKNKELQEFREVFPGDEEFGKRAWTYPNMEAALARYNKI